MRQDVLDAITRANYRRRTRKIDLNDVIQTLAEARRDDYGWMRAGSVANAYDYPATTAAVAAIRLDKDTFAVLCGGCDAKKGSSPVSWFGPRSKRDTDIRVWLESVRKDPDQLKGPWSQWIMLGRLEVLEMLRKRDQDMVARMRELLSTIPNVVVTVEDSLSAGNCPRETERVAKAFNYRPTMAHVVAEKFPELVSFVRKAALVAESGAQAPKGEMI